MFAVSLAMGGSSMRDLKYDKRMALKLTTSYLEDSLELFRYYKKLAELAMDQVSDGQLFAPLDEESNSIAIVVKHMAGNMRSALDRLSHH